MSEETAFNAWWEADGEAFGSKSTAHAAWNAAWAAACVWASSHVDKMAEQFSAIAADAHDPDQARIVSAAVRDIINVAGHILEGAE